MKERKMTNKSRFTYDKALNYLKEVAREKAESVKVGRMNSQQYYLFALNSAFVEMYH